MRRPEIRINEYRDFYEMEASGVICQPQQQEVSSSSRSSSRRCSSAAKPLTPKPCGGPNYCSGSQSWVAQWLEAFCKRRSAVGMHTALLLEVDVGESPPQSRFLLRIGVARHRCSRLGRWSCCCTTIPMSPRRRLKRGARGTLKPCMFVSVPPADRSDFCGRSGHHPRTTQWARTGSFGAPARRAAAAVPFGSLSLQAIEVFVCSASPGLVAPNLLKEELSKPRNERLSKPSSRLQAGRAWSSPPWPWRGSPRRRSRPRKPPNMFETPLFFLHCKRTEASDDGLLRRRRRRGRDPLRRSRGP